MGLNERICYGTCMQCPGAIGTKISRYVAFAYKKTEKYLLVWHLVWL